MNQVGSNIIVSLVFTFFTILEVSAYQNIAHVTGKIDQHSEAEIGVENLNVTLDEEGKFSLKVPVEDNGNLSFSYSGFKLDLFAEPGDSIEIYFSGEKPAETLKFSGSNAAVQAFLSSLR